MLIGLESPLRKLPENLHRKQMLFFDGIRLAIEMIEIAYGRLKENLKILATTRLQAGELTVVVPHVFLDVWLIVDSVNRLRALLMSLPRFKQRIMALQVFYRKTDQVVAFRNLIQHLNTEIDSLVKNDVSVWGTLSWLVLIDSEIMSFKSAVLSSGSQFGEMHTFPSISGVKMYEIVDNVMLVSDGSELKISELVRAVFEFTEKLEKILEPQVKDHPSAASSILFVADMEIHNSQRHGQINDAK